MQAHPHKPQELEQARERRAKGAALDLELEVGDVVWLMGLREGRRTVYRLFDRAGAFEGNDSFDGNAMHLSYEKGRNYVVWRMRRLIETHCPEQWNAMRAENERAENTR